MKSKIVRIPKVLSVFTLAMINVAAIGGVKNWPFAAEYGFSAVFYYILAALIFFFPMSLVAAEFATGWPKKGGVYLWVKEAFGPKMGLLAVWLQWIENIIWYPTVLSFTAATIAYIFDPSLSQNTLYTMIVIIALFWIATIANFYGMKTSGWISNIGAICGTIIPGILIIILGISWIVEGASLQITFSTKSFFPDFSLQHMVYFTGIMLALAGMEMSAVHALDVKNPQRDYSKAILLSALLILGLSLLGVLSIAIVVPTKEISFTAGTMQAFSVFLAKYNLNGLVPIIALLMAIGLFGSVSTWIIGPTKALLAAAQEGHLPHFFHKINKKGMPVALMLAQGIITTILSFMFVLMPTINAGFWILTVLVAQLYLIMYILMFAAGLYLRYKKPHVDRPFKVPGGKFGMWVVAVVGIIGSLFALFIGYFPPDNIQVGNRFFYVGFLIGGTVLGCILPFIFLLFKKPSWEKRTDEIL